MGPGGFMAKRSRKLRAKRKATPRRLRNRPSEAELALAAFAHEIRTSLTGILALGELLVTSSLGEREARWARNVKSTAEHLAVLINLTIDSVRAGNSGLVLRAEPFRLRWLAETLAASLAARAEAKGLRSKAVIAASVPENVLGDAVRLRAALENLIDNAVKFTDKGRIALEVKAKPQADGRVRLEFVVSDTGIGLTPTEIKRVFKPFAQGSEKIAQRYGGAGLGLVFVKRVAQAMGGDLTLTSRPGKGSRFVLTAVAQKTSGSSVKTRRQSVRPDANGALTILCAEDNPYGRVVLNTILTELGHSTHFVGSSDAAVEAVADGNYDLVLMDVMLAGTDGIEATRAIRALPGPRGQVPIVGISGRSTPGDEARGRAAGMDGYLTKPVSPRVLASVIAELAPK